MFYRIRKTGTITIWGHHDQAPSHEILYQYANWKTHAVEQGSAYSRRLKDFKCLAGKPVCSDAQINVTVNAGMI